MLNMKSRIHTPEWKIAQCLWRDCPENRPAQLSYCSECKKSYCITHWDSQVLHEEEGSLHRKIDVSLCIWTETLLNNRIDDERQHKLHEDDLMYYWFGLSTSYGKEKPGFKMSDVYIDLISSSNFPNRNHQFPSLISFVGPTGAGKSTLIVCSIFFINYFRSCSLLTSSVTTPNAGVQACSFHVSSLVRSIHIYEYVR
jgi:hypothetical protein